MWPWALEYSARLRSIQFGSSQELQTPWSDHTYQDFQKYLNLSSQLWYSKRLRFDVCVSFLDNKWLKICEYWRFWSLLETTGLLLKILAVSARFNTDWSAAEGRVCSVLNGTLLLSMSFEFLKPLTWPTPVDLKILLRQMHNWTVETLRLRMWS